MPRLSTEHHATATGSNISAEFQPPPKRMRPIEQQRKKDQKTVLVSSASSSSSAPLLSSPPGADTTSTTTTQLVTASNHNVIDHSNNNQPHTATNNVNHTSPSSEAAAAVAATTTTTTTAPAAAKSSTAETDGANHTATMSTTPSPTLAPKEDSNTTSTTAASAASYSTATEPETSATTTDDTTSKDYYFDSYAHHAIHEEMLKDEVRTRTYEMAIMQNKHLFQDKIVLDVGCGTGILSMFAVQAGAKHVYAVDCSAILEQARKIVQLNGFGDKITCIRGKMEEIELPGVEKVDIIVSEWMGYFLLYESMLDTVLYARDKWLIKDGIVFPDKAVMYVSAMEDAHVKRERIDFWNDVYGFDMTPIKEIAVREPVVDVVDSKALVTDAVPILRLDILTCTKEDLDFTAKFVLHAQRNDYVHALVAYFECAFTQVHKPIGFSTSPFCPYTHWKQTIFYLIEPLTICSGEAMEGEITTKKNNKNCRDLDICLKLNFFGMHGIMSEHVTDYRLR